MDARTYAFRAVFAALDVTGANRALGRLTRGLGVILTLHHVRPWVPRDFAPNRLLEVEPAFLELALGRAAALGFDFVTMDEAAARIGAGRSERPFLHVTFDDGYRDVRDHALPILARHGAPATLYVASDFAEERGELWWLALEAAIDRANTLTVELGDGPVAIACRTTAEKRAAWKRIYWYLRAGPEGRLRGEVRRLAEGQGIDVLSFGRDLCMGWAELAEVATNPLITIGAHTVSHPMLAKHPESVALAEMAQSRAAICENLGRRPDHFAYPVGDLSAVGPRDYRVAADLGFKTAVTTQPGHLTRAHAETMTALPRVSLNGLFQTRAAVDALLTGVPFALLSATRRLAGRG